jgi:hypothetical protein
MQKILGNAVAFVILYIVFMIPTYLLPYFGSNSSIVNLAILWKNPFFWLHLITLLVLVLLAWFRGKCIGKKWLIIFPILALVFDLVPLLNFIPLIPTVMHLLAIILGVVGANAVASQSLKQTA